MTDAEMLVAVVRAVTLNAHGARVMLDRKSAMSFVTPSGTLENDRDGIGGRGGHDARTCVVERHATKTKKVKRLHFSFPFRKNFSGGKKSTARKLFKAQALIALFSSVSDARRDSVPAARFSLCGIAQSAISSGGSRTPLEYSRSLCFDRRKTSGKRMRCNAMRFGVGT